ncbi:MmcQ/YjbR family DNA-binding protein [Aeromicrobium sp. CF3.5]|uniref:MmcQ/YjbR family DNA-binding protein n=1 Tax=Aeromicrobium sp. CF3.5 TaxID=3373078 RepID=UPI003EE5E0CE
MATRPDLPAAWIERIHAALDTCAECRREPAWTGVRWRVGNATVAHLFGGEDQRFRLVVRAELAEVMAFELQGDPYFRTPWGSNVVGLLLDDSTDWNEVAELVVDSYCVQAPPRLAALVDRPDAGP